MAASFSGCHPSQPPEGFSKEIWGDICKIRCTDILLHWISQQLVSQDVGRICEALSISRTASLNTSDDWSVYSDLLSTWLREQDSAETTYLSELVYLLLPLNIKTLDAHSLHEATADLCDQGDVFYDQDGGALLVPRSDSGIGGSLLPFTDHSCSSRHAVCTEFSEVFASPIEEKASVAILSEMVTGGAQRSRGSSQRPKYNINKERMRVLRGTLRNKQVKFASLLQHACDDLNHSRSSVEQLRVFLTQRCVDTHNDIPHFSSFMIDIAKKSTFEEIFVFLSRIGAWHFLNYSILKDIFAHFRSISSQLRQQIREYDDEIEEFKKETLLVDFLAVWGGRCDKDEELPCCRSIIVKSIGDPNSFTIADACDMAGLIAGEFSLNELGALAGGFSGSMYIKWMAPPAVTKHILKVMRSKKRPDLLQFGVLQLAVERTVFKSKYRYESLYKLSLDNPQLFWSGVGGKQLVWRKHSLTKDVFTHNKETGEFQWFKGAQLNVSENCLDVHVSCQPDKIALIWERDNGDTEEVTYRQLLKHTCRVANVLKKRGINKGDVVVICMPTMPLAVASMLACARIGAVHCVLYSDFSDKVLYQRIKEVEARAVITADVRVIDGETKNLKEEIVKALRNGDTSVETVLVANRSDPSSLEEVAGNCFFDSHVTNGVYYCSLEKEMQEVSSDCVPVPMDSEDIFFIVYTSGTEKGTSKAVYHTQAGYLLYTKLTYQFMFNPGPHDKMGGVGDLGWIAAHCLVVYGPLSNGNTTLLFESTATYPDEGRYWKVISKHKLTHFYTIPSVLKELMIRECKGANHIDKYDLSSLKVISLGGEPVPPDIEEWCYSKLGKGKCVFIDNWGQAEIGGAGLVCWKAPDGKKRPDFPMDNCFALFGVECDKDKKGTLCLKQPTPGMAKFISASGNHSKKPYEQGNYLKENGFSTNDILGDSQNQLRVIGRKGRTLLIHGVWLSLGDIENQLRIRMTEDTEKEICDAQVINGGQEESGPLYIVLITCSAVNYKSKRLSRYSKSALLITKDYLKKNLDEMPAALNFKIYFLSVDEIIKRYLQTTSRKASHVRLKAFLNSLNQGSPLPAHLGSSKGKLDYEIIEVTELRKFCQDE